MIPVPFLGIWGEGNLFFVKEVEKIGMKISRWCACGKRSLREGMWCTGFFEIGFGCMRLFSMGEKLVYGWEWDGSEMRFSMGARDVEGKCEMHVCGWYS